jgi:hypothetical protein
MARGLTGVRVVLPADLWRDKILRGHPELAQAILDRDDELRITIPESVKASADDLAAVYRRSV